MKQMIEQILVDRIGTRLPKGHVTAIADEIEDLILETYGPPF